MRIINLCSLGLASILSLIALYTSSTSHSRSMAIYESNVSVIKNKRFALIILFSVFIFVRLYQFGEIPGGVNQDEALSAVDAYYLANNGTDHYGIIFPVHMKAWDYGQQSSLLPYTMVPFIKILGLSIYSVRLPALVISCIGAFFCYLLTKELFGEEVSFILAFLLSVNPWHIMQSRWALDCNLFPHIIIIAVYFLVKSISVSKNNTALLIVSMFFFGLSMYTYGIAIYTVPFFLLITCVLLLYKKAVTKKQVFLAIVSYLFVAWPFIFCMAINYFRLPSIEVLGVTIPFFPNSERSADILFFSDNILRQIGRNLIYFARSAVLQMNGPHFQPWNSIEEFGTSYYFSTPFIVLGAIILICSFFRDLSVTHAVLICFLISCVFCGIVTNSVNINRINIVYYPLLILCSIGIFATISYFKYNASIIFSVYLVLFALFCNTYFSSYKAEIASVFKQDLGFSCTSTMDILNDSGTILVVCDDKDGDKLSGTEALCMYYQIAYNSGNGYNGKVICKQLEPSDLNNQCYSAYVFPYNYASNFSNEKYNLQQFGQFCSAIRK